MLKFKRLQTKIALWVGVCLILTAAIIVVYAAMNMLTRAELNREEAVAYAQEYAAAIAKQHANRIRSELEGSLDAARTLAHMLSGVKDESVDLDLDRDEVNGILRTVLTQNPDFVGVYTVWEPDAFDEMDFGYANEPGYDETGRFAPYWSRNEDGVAVVEPFFDSEQGGADEYYQVLKNTKRESLIDPYLHIVQGTSVLMTSLVAPIVVNDIFYGIVGVDMRLDTLQALVDDVKELYDGAARMLVISYNGRLVAVTGQPELAGESMEIVSEDDFEEDLQNIRHGEEIMEMMEDSLELHTPLTVGQADTVWAISIIVPIEKVTRLADAQMQQALYSVWKMAGIGMSCTILALGFVWIVARNVTKPVIQAVSIAEQLSQGDLTLDIDVTAIDEIGQLQRAMKLLIAQLSGVVIGITSAADQVAAGSQAMSSSAAQMSEGATAQAAATEEASSSMEEMAANIRQNADNALQTEKIALKAAYDAKESGQAVAEAVEAMQEIARKISVIEDITRQTRMLSLNATIEAARAHEHGRGFAVVASEVRALAERSQTAALEISELTSASMLVANKAGDMLKRLVPDIQKTAELVQEISAASKEQDTGSTQINRAIQQLDNVTQQNSATSEELSATAEELAGQAEMLQHAIAFFQVDSVREERPESENQSQLSAQLSARSPSGKSVAGQKFETKTRSTPAGPALNQHPPRDEQDDEFERY